MVAAAIGAVMFIKAIDECLIRIGPLGYRLLLEPVSESISSALNYAASSCLLAFRENRSVGDIDRISCGFNELSHVYRLSNDPMVLRILSGEVGWRRLSS